MPPAIQRRFDLGPSSALDARLIAGAFKQKPRPFTLSTLVHRMAVLSEVHQLHKAINPCEAPAIRHLLARACRGEAG